MFSGFETDRIIRNALDEDIGTGDITTMSTVDRNALIHGVFTAKEDGIICGLPVLKRVFELIDDTISVRVLIPEGEKATAGDRIAEISGNASGILSGERVALNFLQRMSGIATVAKGFSEKVKGTSTVITDTRKTTPGLRLFEKYAVRTGGGTNHRFNLSDGVLIKDNHIAAAGGITAAVRKCRAMVPHLMKIEVETENISQIEEALNAGADVIMLDNMSLAEMKEAVSVISGRAIVEASGNMGEKDIAEIARTGVDLISIGALTHSAKAMDISLKFEIS